MEKVKIISDTIQEFLGERYYLCGNYFQKNGIRLHREVWEFHKEEIPEGFHVHHKKEDRSKNQIEDLQLLTESEHLSLHMKDRIMIFSPQCREAANKWHGSEAGKKWHDKHYENTKDALHQSFERECTWCGEIFESKRKNVDAFCSNNCKSAYRRASGVDDIEKICEVCSKPFTTSKYSKVRACSRSCGRKL